MLTVQDSSAYLLGWRQEVVLSTPSTWSDHGFPPSVRVARDSLMVAWLGKEKCYQRPYWCELVVNVYNSRV